MSRDDEAVAADGDVHLALGSTHHDTKYLAAAGKNPHRQLCAKGVLDEFDDFCLALDAQAGELRAMSRHDVLETRRCVSALEPDDLARCRTEDHNDAALCELHARGSALGNQRFPFG